MNEQGTITGLRPRANRLPLDLTVSFRELPSTSRWQSGRTVNVSQTGMLFQTAVVRSELSIGTPLEFVIVLSGRGSGVDSAEIGVVRCTGRIVRHQADQGNATRDGLVATIDRYRLTRLSSISSESGRIGAAVESASPTASASTGLELYAPDLELATRLDVSVLITSETRSARESSARLIHSRGVHRQGPFIHVQCDSARFGSDELHFWRRLLAEAHGGTLFLDEVDAMPLRLQGDLLDVLDAARPDVRVISGTSQSLVEQVAARTFLQTLFYRLNIIHIDCSRPAFGVEPVVQCVADNGYRS